MSTMQLDNEKEENGDVFTLNIIKVSAGSASNSATTLVSYIHDNTTMLYTHDFMTKTVYEEQLILNFIHKNKSRCCVFLDVEYTFILE